MRFHPGRASCALLVAAAALAVSCSKEKAAPERISVSRRDMAKYLIEARGESPATGCTTPFFTDVPCSDAGWGWIEKLRTDELTHGCDPSRPLYCPDRSVTRAQAAMFVSRAATGGESSVPVTYGPDPVTGRKYDCSPNNPSLHFKDIKTSDIYCQHTHYLWARGAIPEGENYRPVDDVTRQEMEEMVRKGFEVRKGS